MARVVIRPATRADYIALYQDSPRTRFKGCTATLDGEAIGIAGVYHRHSWVAFCRIKPLLRNYPVSIYRASLHMLALMEEINAPVFAIADPSIPRSEQLLMKMGFNQVSKDWYVWTP